MKSVYFEIEDTCGGNKVTLVYMSVSGSSSYLCVGLIEVSVYRLGFTPKRCDYTGNNKAWQTSLKVDLFFAYSKASCYSWEFVPHICFSDSNPGYFSCDI